MKEVFEKNLAIIFDKSKSFNLQDIYLEDLQTTMTNVEARVKTAATERYSQTSEVEVSLNDGSIMIEMHDLYIEGSGFVKDPDTGILEKITFRAPVSSGYIEIIPS